MLAALVLLAVTVTTANLWMLRKAIEENRQERT